MAWRARGSSNADLVQQLVAHGVAKHSHTVAALHAVDRGYFVPKGTPAEEAYGDHPLPIGHAATISAPHMHAACLDRFADKLVPGSRVLDVGSGSGVLVAAFATLVFPASSATQGPGESPSETPPPRRGVVVGVEHIPELVEWSRANILAALPQQAPAWLASGDVQLVAGDGRLGHAAAAPYDIIHVGAAAPVVPPALVAQLAPGGRMVIPVGPEGGAQVLMEYARDAASGRVTARELLDVRYVPLTDAARQRSSW